MIHRMPIAPKHSSLVPLQYDGCPSARAFRAHRTLIYSGRWSLTIHAGSYSYFLNRYNRHNRIFATHIVKCMTPSQLIGLREVGVDGMCGSAAPSVHRGLFACMMRSRAFSS